VWRCVPFRLDSTGLLIPLKLTVIVEVGLDLGCRLAAAIRARRLTPSQRTAGLVVRELDPDLVDGLRDLDGFSHLTLLYHLHLITRPG
jgi:hypothetical protein